jgi:hypothetical protein
MDFFRNAMPICLAHAETLVHATIHFAFPTHMVHA